MMPKLPYHAARERDPEDLARDAADLDLGHAKERDLAGRRVERRKHLLRGRTGEVEDVRLLRDAPHERVGLDPVLHQPEVNRQVVAAADHVFERVPDQGNADGGVG